MTSTASLEPGLRLGMIQADPDSDVATQQTIRLMAEIVGRSRLDPLVTQTASDACRMFRGGPFYRGADPLADPVATAHSVYWWAKHFVRVVPHQEFKRLVSAYPAKRQLIIAPSDLLRMPVPKGDCAVFSVLVASMLQSCGVPYEFVSLATTPEDPGLYDHVFVRAVLPDGSRLSLDASHGEYPGWEVPRARQLRRQVWNVSGEPISDERTSRLSEFVPRRRRRGLGQDDTFSPVDYGPSAAQLGIPSGAVIVPSQSSTDWGAVVTQLTKAGMTLAEIYAIQPGTVVGANGQILRQSAGLPVPVGSPITAALGSSNAVWLVGGAVLLGVFMIMLVSTRR